MSKLTPKVILEGTRLTYKTEIAFALNEHPRFTGPRKYRYHSPLISAEWCTFTNYPWGRGLINFEPEEEAQALLVQAVERFNPIETVTTFVSPVIGAHTGPGTVSIAYQME